MYRLKLFYLLFLFFICIHVSGAKGRHLLRVATWNAENYLITSRVLLKQDKNQFRKKWPKPEEEKSALRRVISSVNPDILALQEIGPEFVPELQRDLSAEGRAYPYVAVMSTAFDKKRCLAVFSKIPFDTVNYHSNLTFKYLGQEKNVMRGLLECVFKFGNQKWSLFNLHLKSRTRDKASDREWRRYRNLEAKAICHKINSLYKRTHLYLLLGDFNSYPTDSSLKRFKNKNKEGQVTALPIIASDSRGEEWTHYWKSRKLYSCLDYILMSTGMLALNPNAQATLYDHSDVLKASDHRLLYVDIDLKDIDAESS